MHSSLTPGYGLWLEPIVVLAVGTAVVVGLAAIAARWGRSAAWQRAIWQASTVGLLALLVVELTGSGSAFVQLVRTRAGPSLGDLAAPAASRQAGNSVLKTGATAGLSSSAADHGWASHPWHPI